MKQRLADYVADFLVNHGVTDCFSVVGGGSMYLSNALGHRSDIKVTYNHHEQASAMAAESYARLNNKIALVCVTTGPGGTNTLTGVVGGWLDSIPMFIISGQVRYDTTARYNERFTEGFKLRAVGDQEYDIVKSVKPMTKYATMLEDPADIGYVLQKAWKAATCGRPGPVWIDIPVNFQSAVIETEQLRPYRGRTEVLPPKVSAETVKAVLTELRKAKRPVIYAGNGIRLSGGYEIFRKVIEKLQVPVVTYWESIDLIESDNPLYVGRGGYFGDRAGNFAVQNSDLVLAIGTRISIRQTSSNYKSWARAAKVIMVDIDRAEMKKPTIHVDMPIWADAKDFLQKLDKAAECVASDNGGWLETCRKWREKYPVVTDKQRAQDNGYVNVYAFIEALSSRLPENSLTAVSNGACCVAGHQAYVIKKGSRFIINNAIASMGYGLPAALGLCVSSGRKTTVCLEGDGSIMMNLQELQTIITNALPIKIFLINNSGYHSIRISQRVVFKDQKRIGIGDSDDLSFPDYGKIAEAFGYPYYCIKNNGELAETLDRVLNSEGYAICEVFTDTLQEWEPRYIPKRFPDGRVINPPLEDLSPFLSDEELAENMFIDEDSV